MSGPQPPPSENYEYEPDEFASSQNAERLLQAPRRSFAGPIIIFIAGVVLGAIGFSRINLLKPPSQNEVPIPPKQPERFLERTIEPVDPSKSLMLDRARSYIDPGSLSFGAAKNDLATKR
jgi:hypothetical protein